MRAQGQVVVWHQHLRELLYEALDGGKERSGDGGEHGCALAVPQAVLEPEETCELRAAHTADEPERPPVDLGVEVAEGVVGGTKARVVEVSGEPKSPGEGQVAAAHRARQPSRRHLEALHPDR